MRQIAITRTNRPLRRLALAGVALSLTAGALFGLSGSSRAEAAVFFCDGLQATIVGTPANDTVVGTAGMDVIVGLDGDDIIRGLDGDDVICGGIGNDTIDGGNGSDDCDGGAGTNVVSNC